LLDWADMNETKPANRLLHGFFGLTITAMVLLAAARHKRATNKAGRNRVDLR